MSGNDMYYDANAVPDCVCTAYIVVDGTSSVELPSLKGKYGAWEFGHTYTLRLHIEPMSADVDLDSISVSTPQVELQCQVDDNTVSYSGTVDAAGYYLSIYLCKSGSEGYVATAAVSGTVSDSFEGLEYGATYCLYVNRTNVSDPSAG